ncbi:MAG: metallophosphoesterase [Sphaerochaetaceae bacterium]|nr:metallophosphoesterase [Sphaerochaetaceae bacterium]
MSYGYRKSADVNVRLKTSVHQIIMYGILLSIFLLFSCSQPDYSHVETRDLSGGFDQPIDMTGSLESFSFLVLNDIHFGREDKGVYWKFDEFWQWLDTYPGSIDFALNLGDFTEDSQEDEYLEYADFIQDLANRSIPMHTVAGNHDIRNRGRSYFSTYVCAAPYKRFAHKGISFYMIDTGNRSLGNRQLEELIKETAQDTNLKMFCSHVPLYGSPDLIYFALPDTQERMMLLKTMVDEKVGIYFSGHHHSGDVLYKYTEENSEFIFGAFHGRDSFFESTLPRWYVCTYDSIKNSLGITRHTVQKDGSITEVLIANLIMP